MRQIWYGLWQEMYYYLAWPWRFLIELIITCLILIAIWEFCKWLVNTLHLKKYGIKLVVFLVTEFDRLLGKNTVWALENDEKIIDWGRKRVSAPSEKWHFIKGRLKKFLIVFVIVTYILAVLPELPFSSVFDSGFMKNLSEVENYFQEKEAALSKGYEKYSPLFRRVKVKKEKELNKSEENKKILLNLKKTGKGKIKIYKKPSEKTKVIVKISENDKIIYKNKFKKNGKMYWLKVYLPKKKVTGWIDSRYVKEKQTKQLLKTKKL